MIKVVLPRTMMISKVEGESSIYNHYVGHPIKEIVSHNCEDYVAIYLDDIQGTIYAWTDEPWSRYINDPEYDEYREYHEFMKNYGEIVEQLKSYKIPEARAALIISQVLAIYAGSEKKCED